MRGEQMKHHKITTFSRRSIILGVAPAILLYLILGVGPSLATFFFSFTDISGLKGAPWHWVGLANYKEYFVTQNYRDYIDVIKRTLIYALATTVIQNVIALFVALLLNAREIKGRNFYRAVIFMPVVLGVMVTAISWTLFFNSVDGPAAAFLALFGKYNNFFGDQKLAFVLCIAAQIWMYMGYSMVIFLAGLQTIPQELYEAAKIDGSNTASEFRYVTFPLLWPSITVNGLMSIIGSLSSFQIILLTTGGNFNTTTLSMTAYANAFGLGKIASITGLRQGYAAAINMVLFTIILVFVLIFQGYMKKKEAV